MAALTPAAALRGARAGGLHPRPAAAVAHVRWLPQPTAAASTWHRPLPPAAPCRAFASAPPQPDVYGAPFTNSIVFAPSPPSPPPPPGDASAPPAPPAPAYQLRLRVPDLGQGDVPLAPGDSLAAAAAAVARVTGAVDVRFACNGRALLPHEAAATRLDAVFGTSVDLQLDGLRYSVNRGLLLTPAGSAPKRSPAAGYLLVAAGGAAAFAGCFAFWHSFLGVRRNKIKQLLQQ